MTGEDAADFLQSQFSNDVRQAADAPVYGLWLDHRGKIHGDGVVLREDAETWWIFSEGTPLPHLKEKLERHIIADDVELVVPESAIDGLVVFGLDGDSKKAVEAFLQDGAGSAKPFLFADREGRLQMVGETDAIDAAETVLHREGLVSASLEDYDGWRFSRGLPLIPNEVGPNDFPGEAGLAEFCNPSKGCYLGQEVVARQQRLDRGTRTLVSVSLNGEPPTLPVGLEIDGAAIGELRAVVRKETQWLGLAMVKTRARQGSSRFTVSAAEELEGAFLGD